MVARPYKPGIPALAVIGVLLTLNLVSVKNFGEIELVLHDQDCRYRCPDVGGGMVAVGFTSPSGARASLQTSGMI